MARTKRNKDSDLVEDGVKLAIGLILLLALAGGSFAGLTERLIKIAGAIFLIAIMIGSIAGIVFILKKKKADRHLNQAAKPDFKNYIKETAAATELTQIWKTNTILERLEEIDWYQFEKFCAALLEAEGYSVERKGGAQPDGGVDIIASKFDGNDTLIQCKHWNAWKVGEPTVRQMLGSMADFGVQKGAVYTMKGWTRPAEVFALRHNIQMVSGRELAKRAEKKLIPELLSDILNSDTHHCPKCEALMVLRTGDFDPFWGCSTFPRCRGRIKIAKEKAKRS